MKTRSRNYNPPPPRVNRKRKTPVRQPEVQPEVEPETETEAPTVVQTETQPGQTVNQKSVQENNASTSEKTLRDKLNVLYTDITSKPSYSAKIADFLRQHDVHGVYRRIIKKTFPRRRVIARFPFEIFMGDLLEYPQYKYKNKGYKFILVLIDCFTKKLYTAAMKRKSKESAAEAFESIFKNFDRYPINLVTDRGLEFYNSEVQKIFDSYGINHYSIPTKTKWKASQAERVIRTIKSRLEKYFHRNKTTKWIDVLDQLTSNYNATPHSAHKLAPQDVTDTNRKLVYKRMYPDQSLTIVCKLKKGDKVRKIRDKTLFEKGYTENWSREIYKISEVRQSNAVCWYKLENLAGEPQDGIWYYYQLNLVARDDH